ncbi:Holliday junction resolvase RuvX [Rhodothermus profundi]|uniref:Putative pre-16S rRNA nuclease n=1 Tax=Rhodothermus profundi TaxID=633813 RepID=A0A1M6X456_9BACT|nr:Holliday junction resolvase RuvX [Rhodothermus profundi]SHL00565.1 putative holliday junction resolvase [Rhodothermus profundi]
MLLSGATRPRVVGIDYGRRRVGLALADPLRIIAQPYGTYPPEEALRVLQRLHAEEGIETLVVGWPLTEAGTEGAATRQVARFIRRLERLLPGVKIVRWDERYTSELARERLREVGGSRKKRRERGRVDQMAAAIILQEYLEYQEPKQSFPQ